MAVRVTVHRDLGTWRSGTSRQHVRRIFIVSKNGPSMAVVATAVVVAAGRGVLDGVGDIAERGASVGVVAVETVAVGAVAVGANVVGGLIGAGVHSVELVRRAGVLQNGQDKAKAGAP